MLAQHDHQVALVPDQGLVRVARGVLAVYWERGARTRQGSGYQVE
jgi:hypothetical protein